MIQLNQTLFRRAAIKAASVRPSVEKNGARYFVSRADGGLAVVRFLPRDNALWCECTCPAGSPQSRHLPLPCYHVAAVLLTIRRPQEHKHTCPECGTPSPWTCNCGDTAAPFIDCDCLPDHGDHRYWN